MLMLDQLTLFPDALVVDLLEVIDIFLHLADTALFEIDPEQ
jgi:hypothetical protein